MNHRLLVVTVTLTLLLGRLVLAPPAAFGAQNAESLRNLLPTSGEMPAGMVQRLDATRTLDQVAPFYADPDDVRQRFITWGWQGNAIRGFAWPEAGVAPPDGVSDIYISIHQFTHAAGASQALDYVVADNITQYGGREIALESLGDRSRATLFTADVGTTIDLFVQRGDFVIAVKADSPHGDPQAVAMQVTQAILGNIDAAEAATTAEPAASQPRPATAVATPV